MNDILLNSANTMNGWKRLIFLYEVGVDHDFVPVSFTKKEQNAPDNLNAWLDRLDVAAAENAARFKTQ